MEIDLISIIVPCYNCESYILKCVESIKKQSYTNLEIILINDGSTDNTDNICENIKNTDSRIKYIRKENKGVSNTRNLGISESTGEYIMFVDSDDYIDEHYVEELYRELKNNNVNIVISGATRVLENESITKTFVLENNNCKYKIEDIIDDVINTIYFSSACKMLIKKEILNGLVFEENLVYGEDLYFTYNLIKKYEIFYSANCGYYYVENKKSVTNNTSKEKLIIYMDNNDYIFNNIKKDFPERGTLIANRLYSKYNIALIRLLSNTKVNYMQFKTISKILSEKVSSNGVKINKIHYENSINKIRMNLLYYKCYFLYYYFNRIIIFIKRK